MGHTKKIYIWKAFLNIRQVLDKYLEKLKAKHKNQHEIYFIIILTALHKCAAVSRTL